MKVSKSAFKGGGGMDTATKRDAMVDKMSRAMTSAINAGRLSNQDVERMLKTMRDKKAGGGKAKKMMAGGGKTKKMMRGGGKTKKYMARGGKAK